MPRPRTSHALALGALAATFGLAHPAFGQSASQPATADGAPKPAPSAAEADEDDRAPLELPRLILDTGRPERGAPPRNAIRFGLHGEYQLRAQRQNHILLTPSASRIEAVPGIVEDSTGQLAHMHHWLRLTPVLELGDRAEVVGQMDLVTGLVAYGPGLARDVHADQTPRDEIDAWSNIQPRWLYATVRTDFGVFRFGQQGSFWGLGMLVNDGDHPTLFGDYRYGSIFERVAFATKPLGKESPLVVGVAGDLVFRDSNAKLVDGEIAYQGSLFALLERDKNNQLGLLGIYRSQRRDRESGSSLFTYTEGLDVGVVDATGRFATRAPGATDTFVFGGAEVAAIFGKTDMLRRTIGQEIVDTKVRSYGAAARLGVVHRGRQASSLDREDLRTYGCFVGQVEIGYASGDANPYDDVQKRFAFADNYRVGLLLFDEVMRWQTARAATAAQDPKLTNAARPTPGADRLATNGAIFGAQYLNPTFVVRPRQWLDLKGGVVVAQTSSDNVDPYRTAIGGNYVNYRGGTPLARDLGVEIDGGFEARLPANRGLTIALGAQAGILFPGQALANAAGSTLDAPWLAIGRAGLVF